MAHSFRLLGSHARASGLPTVGVGGAVDEAAARQAWGKYSPAELAVAAAAIDALPYVVPAATSASRAARASGGTPTQRSSTASGAPLVMRVDTPEVPREMTDIERVGVQSGRDRAEPGASTDGDHDAGTGARADHRSHQRRAGAAHRVSWAIWRSSLAAITRVRIADPVAVRSVSPCADRLRSGSRVTPR
ncbi:hypothetical protein [Amycolatopsis sp. BJA-103]|uniref:hypothetical protein n=1 Tax=Amycolatopsis sp. BJA-103 TaxID=1911175 RepID=UPI000C775F13|nr:hypothetical protein [Amycolatopsis sp. BJA-103]AUI57344.1 hypothetical protein BKN51_03355 [Amycolatopsis sp. BJA-103]PNE13155.1 hypothetical protein B1H26_42095 [Amycolatopsis sp. BJA-103]